MQKATRIIAIRHGETDWNAAGRIQGHTDIALNATGQRQAAQMARALVGERLDAVYSSDLQRARDTARALADACGAPLHTQSGLRERGFGRFEGQTFAAIEAADPDAARRWHQRAPDFVPPGGGESLCMLRQRIAQTAARLALRHPGGHIALVAHGGVLDMLYRLATGQDVRAARTWRLDNCAINRLLHSDQGFTLVGWGDVRHLDAAARDEVSA